jgi:hypothetical protein
LTTCASVTLGGLTVAALDLDSSVFVLAGGTVAEVATDADGVTVAEADALAVADGTSVGGAGTKRTPTMRGHKMPTARPNAAKMPTLPNRTCSSLDVGTEITGDLGDVGLAWAIELGAN